MSMKKFIYLAAVFLSTINIETVSWICRNMEALIVDILVKCDQCINKSRLFVYFEASFRTSPKAVQIFRCLATGL